MLCYCDGGRGEGVVGDGLAQDVEGAGELGVLLGMGRDEPGWLRRSVWRRAFSQGVCPVFGL